MHSTGEPTESMSGPRRTDGSSLWEPLAADGIGRIRYAKGDVVSEDLAKTTIVELKVLGGGKPIPVLVDIRQMKSVSREARAIFGGPHAAFSALALLADSPRTQVIANFFIALSHPKVPTQMFSDEEKALAWLRRHGA
jgi:hypothetical protein